MKIPTLNQTDLRITNHGGHNFPPLLTLFSFTTRIERPPVLTATLKFSKRIFQLLQYSSHECPSFCAYRAALMTKTNLTFPAFSLRLVDFAINSAFSVSFHSTRSDARVKFDSRVIFLDQSQFFAVNSNQ